MNQDVERSVEFQEDRLRVRQESKAGAMVVVAVVVNRASATTV